MEENVLESKSLIVLKVIFLKFILDIVPQIPLWKTFSRWLRGCSRGG